MQPELPDFDEVVRQPGLTFLARNPHPNEREFRSHAYWRKILREFRDAYGGICAYSCHWVPYDTGADTVEHFLPKRNYPGEAYEWANYRFVCSRLNGRKGTHEDVVDPFLIKTGWFVIEFPSLLVKPAAQLRRELKSRVIATIERLGLNEEATCLKQRYRYVRDYCVEGLPFNFLQRDAPFLAHEVARQDYIRTLNDVMGF
jgi:hypothetical protein